MSARAWDYVHRRCWVSDCVSDSPLTQLKELSNSCSVLGHKWELGVLAQINVKQWLEKGKGKKLYMMFHLVWIRDNCCLLLRFCYVSIIFWIHTQAAMTQMPLINCMNIYYCLGQFILGFITVISFFLNLRLAACAAPEICLEVAAGAGHSCLLRKGNFPSRKYMPLGLHDLHCLLGCISSLSHTWSINP